MAKTRINKQGFMCPIKASPAWPARRSCKARLYLQHIIDTDAAFELVCAFDPATPACAIIKHANPCGVALGDNLADAFARALACDAVSAYGGLSP